MQRLSLTRAVVTLCAPPRHMHESPSMVCTIDRRCESCKLKGCVSILRNSNISDILYPRKGIQLAYGFGVRIRVFS